MDTKTLRTVELEVELQRTTFSVLRRLCARIGHLPESYLLPDKFDLSGMPHTFGGFADVWKGVLRGKDVAVKSLRVSVMDDKSGIRKVANKATISHASSLTYYVALLRRGCHVEELVPSQPSRSRWSP